MSRALIGTAGWTIPRAHAEQVPPGPSALARYAQVFSLLEINSSFWRRHQPKTWVRWAATVPARFVFAVKLPRVLTHVDGLRIDAAVLDDFFADVAGLGEKLGPLLVQLPPSLAYEPRRARAFFSALRARHRGDLVCEPRHESWFAPKADALLASLEIARVAADPPRAATGAAPGGHRALAYFRLHGSPAMYRTPYGPERCAALAEAIRRERGRVFCVFDNTASGAALGDALLLRALLATARAPAG